MSWCLTAPTHFLNQYWLITKDVMLHSHESNFTRSAPELLIRNMYSEIILLKLQTHLPGANELKSDLYSIFSHDDVIKWKHFQRDWPFVRGIHRSPVNSPHKGQWRGALMFSLICARINGSVNNRGAGDLSRHRVHYDVIVIIAASHPTTRPTFPVGTEYTLKWT